MEKMNGLKEVLGREYDTLKDIYKNTATNTEEEQYTLQGQIDILEWLLFILIPDIEQ